MQRLIAEIQTAGPDGRARRLQLVDGTERLTSAAAVARLSLATGDPLDESALSLAELELARDRALTYLGYRERSCQQLRRRLADDGYPAQTVEAISARLEETGLLDDERFAFAFARTRALSGKGRRLIQRELLERGVSEELALSAVEDAVADEQVAARDALRGRTPRSAAEREKLIRLLVRRGFPLQLAVAVVNSSVESEL